MLRINFISSCTCSLVYLHNDTRNVKLWRIWCALSCLVHVLVYANQFCSLDHGMDIGCRATVRYLTSIPSGRQ